MPPRAERRRAAALAAAALLVGACAAPPPAPAPAPPPAPVDSVILLPAQDGRGTAVTLAQDGRSAVVDRPYAGARTGPAGPQGFQSSAAEVQAKFGAALAAQPPRPASFLLYFVEGRDSLTEASRAVVDRVFAEIAARPAPDIVVIGHTDSVGSQASNDALSLQRAESIRRELIRRGIGAENVIASGRGERELLVPTGDNVAEPRNRRVEIIVR
ncbi:MAG: OmpA family protein [Burkholderiales bacterium]|nr:OmpA family protein [Burkholderiales bacterium]